MRIIHYFTKTTSVDTSNTRKVNVNPKEFRLDNLVVDSFNQEQELESQYKDSEENLNMDKVLARNK